MRSFRVSQADDTSITLTERTFPLQFFFNELGFDREGNTMIFFPTPEHTIAWATSKVEGVCATWGWNVITAAPAPPGTGNLFV